MPGPCMMEANIQSTFSSRISAKSKGSRSLEFILTLCSTQSRVLDIPFPKDFQAWHAAGHIVGIKQTISNVSSRNVVSMVMNWPSCCNIYNASDFLDLLLGEMKH